ncbi:MAG: aldo/keto reductase [Alphaproteobacteria bacterium]|nr:aldo/keto reductase [Alphaproteobacteria bacterium]
MGAIKKNVLPGAGNLEISELSFGGAPIAGLFDEVGEQSAIRAVQSAMQAGINFFDSALLYGGGKSLEILGEALGEHPPKDVVVSFKVGRVLVDSPDQVPDGKECKEIEGFAGDKRYYYDYSKEGVQKAFEQSMECFNRGRAKKGWAPLTAKDLNLLVLVHDPGKAEHGAAQPAVMSAVMRESFPALWEMQQQGIIKGYGIGTNEIGPCLRALDDPHISVLLPAGRFTLLCNGATAAPQQIQEDSRNLPALLNKIKTHSNQPRIIAAAIGNSGLGYGGPNYNYAPASSEVKAFREKVAVSLQDYNGSHGTNYTMPQLLARYALDQGDGLVATVMPGPRSESEVQQAVDAHQATIPDDLWKYLADRGLTSSRDGLHTQPSARRMA